MIDLIFEQPQIPYLLTHNSKMVYYDTKWKLVTYYGDYFRKMNFEIQPCTLKFTPRYLNKQRAQNKNPLEYSLHKYFTNLESKYKLKNDYFWATGMDLD
jgi:hypothetical protein